MWPFLIRVTRIGCSDASLMRTPACTPMVVAGEMSRVSPETPTVEAVLEGHAQADDPLLAVVERVRKRPHGRAALLLDRVDQLLVGRHAEVLVRRERVGREREPAGERHETDGAQRTPAEPAPLRPED